MRAPAGFSLWHTGGNCTAFGRVINRRSPSDFDELYLTEFESPTAPSSWKDACLTVLRIRSDSPISDGISYPVASLAELNAVVEDLLSPTWTDDAHIRESAAFFASCKGARA